MKLWADPGEGPLSNTAGEDSKPVVTAYKGTDVPLARGVLHPCNPSTGWAEAEL